MPLLEVRRCNALVDDAHDLVDAIEQLEHIRRDARATALLVSARRFLADIETYFEAAGDVPTPDVPSQPLPEALAELSSEAFRLADKVCLTTGGPGSSALLQYAGLLRNSAVIYVQHQRRMAAEAQRQLELPSHELRALPAMAVGR
jgi:hypothetical protein